MGYKTKKNLEIERTFPKRRRGPNGENKKIGGATEKACKKARAKRRDVGEKRGFGVSKKVGLERVTEEGDPRGRGNQLKTLNLGKGRW